MASLNSSALNIPDLSPPAQFVQASSSSLLSSLICEESDLPKIFQTPARLALHPKNQENYQLARDAPPMTFNPLPEHLTPAAGTRILPPVLHYGYAVPLDRIMTLDALLPTRIRASPSTFLIARMVHQANEWLQENVFKARVVTATVVDEQAKFVFSLYTNYTVEEKRGRADVCAVEENLREWLSTEGVEEMEAKWYVDGEDWHWRWSAASR